MVSFNSAPTSVRFGPTSRYHRRSFILPCLLIRAPRIHTRTILFHRERAETNLFLSFFFFFFLSWIETIRNHQTDFKLKSRLELISDQVQMTLLRFCSSDVIKFDRFCIFCIFLCFITMSKTQVR